MVGAFMLLLGVAIFSYIMGNFIEILNSFQSYRLDIDDSSSLYRFFSVIRMFNANNVGLDETLQK